MASNPEIQFRTSSGGVLVNALRAALGDEGTAPPRDQIAGWIAEGRVRVENDVVWDPERIVAAGQNVELMAWPRSAALFGEHTPDDVVSLQYLDPDLVVAEYTPRSSDLVQPMSLTDQFRRLLTEAGVLDMDPVPIPGHEMRASGLVSARLTPKGKELVDDSPWPLGARVAVRAVVAAPAEVDLTDLMFAERNPDAMLVRTPPQPSSVAVLEDLESRGLRVLEADDTHAPTGQRPLLLHVAGLALTHPRTCRTHQWACRQPAAFDAALSVRA